MLTSAIICPQCQRVIALGCDLPALCLSSIPAQEWNTLRGEALRLDARVHRDCVQMQVLVEDELAAEDQLAQVERTYAEQLSALGALAKLAKGGA